MNDCDLNLSVGSSTPMTMALCTLVSSYHPLTGLPSARPLKQLREKRSYFLQFERVSRSRQGGYFLHYPHFPEASLPMTNTTDGFPATNESLQAVDLEVIVYQ